MVRDYCKTHYNAPILILNEGKSLFCNSLGTNESFNGRLRDECLNVHLFRDVREARNIIETWRWDYNTQRPHTSLGGKTPLEVKKMAYKNTEIST